MHHADKYTLDVNMAKECKAFALHLWDRLPGPYKRSFMWDVPVHKQRDALCHKLDKAVYCGMARECHKPFGMALVMPLFNGGNCCEIHMAFMPGNRFAKLQLARKFFHDCIDKIYESSMGIIPNVLKPSIRFAMDLGFECLADIPDAIYMVNNRRYSGASLMARFKPLATDNGLCNGIDNGLCNGLWNGFDNGINVCTTKHKADAIHTMYMDQLTTHFSRKICHETTKP